MKTIKEAADSLLSKGKISKEEYLSLEKAGEFEKTSTPYITSPSAAKKFREGIRTAIVPSGAPAVFSERDKENIYDSIQALLFEGKISKEEYLSLEKAGEFEKTSGYVPPPSVAKRFLEGMRAVSIPLAALGVFGAIAKENIYDPIQSERAIDRSFSMMSSKVPQLAEKNKDEIKDYFQVVKTFSPKAASNPLVAGALVNKMMEFGGVDNKLVQDIAAIELGMQQPTLVRTMADAAAKSIVTLGE